MKRGQIFLLVAAVLSFVTARGRAASPNQPGASSLSFHGSAPQQRAVEEGDLVEEPGHALGSRARVQDLAG